MRPGCLEGRQDLIGSYMLARPDQISSRPHCRNLRHLLEFMTQTAGGVGFELAHDTVRRENGWRRHCDVDAIWKDRDVFHVYLQSFRGFTEELLQASCRRPCQAGFAAHGSPHEVVHDPLVHELEIL